MNKVNNIGMGLKRINDESQKRVKCEVLGINQYRLENNKLEYQVFWKGRGSDIQMSWQTIQNLQQCKDEIRKVVSQKKTKGISKRRSAFPTYQSRNVLNNNKSYQNNPITKQSSSNIIFLIPDIEKNHQKSNALDSISSEEGEIKLQYCHYSCLSINSVEQPYKEDNFQKQQQYRQHEQQPNYLQYSETYEPPVKENQSDQKLIFCSIITSQNRSQVESTLQVSGKLQSYNQINKESVQQKSINFKIYQQTSCQVSFKPKISYKQISYKQNKTITEQRKQKKKLHLSSNQTSINIEPVKKENVLVTKLIKDGSKMFFQIMVYDEDGHLVKQRISSQQLRIKAPYALLKFYESRIII